MSSITVTQDCYWGGSEYNWAGLVWNDSITFNNGASLVVDPSVYTPTNFDIGVKLIGTSGFSSIQIINNSTSTPLLHYGPTSGKIQIKNGCSLSISGNYIQLGNGSGSANQVLSTAWTDAGFSIEDEPATIEIETGSGTDIYETWYNVTQAFDLSYIGIDRLGKWFLYNTSDGSITFGDYGATTAGCGGNIIPSGAKIRVYNIGIGTKNSFGVKTIYGTSSDYSFDSLDGGYVNIDKCYFFGFYPYLNKYTDLNISNVGSVRGFYFYQSKGGSLDNVNVCHNKYSGSNPALNINNTISTTIINSNFSRGNTGTNYQTINFQYACKDNYFYNCKSFFINRQSNSCYVINTGGNGDGCVFENLLFAGASVRGNAPSQQFKNILASDSCNGVDVGGNYRSLLNIETRGASLDGFQILSEGTPSGSGVYAVFGVDSISNCDSVFSNAYAFDTPALSIFSVKRSQFIGGISGLGKTDSSLQPYRMLLQNVKNGFVGPVYPYGYCPSNAIYKGVDVGSTPFETATGAGVVNTHFADLFQSETTGVLGLIFSPKTSDNNDFVISGSVKIVTNGYLYIISPNGSITFTWSYWIKGHLSFPSDGYMFHDGSGDNNFTYEYDIDVGNGFSGTFKTIDHVNNLQYETIDPDIGFRLKIKISHSTGSLTNYVRRFFITTTSDRDNYLYPISENTLTLTGIPEGSEIRIYNESGIELGGIENSSGDFVLSYAYEGVDIVATLRIVSFTYKIFEQTIILSNSNNTIPISLQKDQWAYDPA